MAEQEHTFNLTSSSFLNRKYKQFYDKHGYIPEMFEPYNCAEITDIAPTITSNSNTSSTTCGTVLIVVEGDS